jgi:hypothetical protein
VTTGGGSTGGLTGGGCVTTGRAGDPPSSRISGCKSLPSGSVERSRITESAGSDRREARLALG